MIDCLVQPVLAQAEPGMFMSWYKPVLFVLLLGAWAWAVSNIDKDTAYYYMPRRPINFGLMAAGIVGFGLLLWLPIFWLGLAAVILICGGSLLGYAMYRNEQVPDDARWSFSTDMFTRQYEAYQRAQAEKSTHLRLLDPKDKSPRPKPQPDDDDYPAHTTLEQVLEFAFSRNAQQVELVITQEKAQLVVWVDGVKYPQPEIEADVAMQLLDYVKAAAGLDLADRRKRQSAQLPVEAAEYGQHYLQLNTAGSTRGVSLQLEIDPHTKINTPFKQLGLLDAQLHALEPVIQQRGGVVLVAAPQDQGMSTTLYSLLQEHDPYTAGVATFMDEPAYPLEGVTNHRLPTGVGPQQANEKLGALLRSDPDVVMMSRIFDAQTARLVSENAEHTRFYLGMREEDTFATLKKWLKLVGDRDQVGQTLSAILVQRLIRRLCNDCRVAYKPDPAALKKLNLQPERVGQLYQATGKVKVKDQEQMCPTCYGLGYKGRVGVFEVMLIDRTAGQLIGRGDMDQLRSHLRKQKMFWLHEAALARAVEGQTDIRELTRALGSRLAGASDRSGQQTQDAQKAQTQG